MTGRIPKIAWGAGFTGSLEFGYPLDFAISYSKPREGSDRVQFVSGEESSWITGTDFTLNGQVRWIPTNSGSSSLNVAQSGWDGQLGWQSFLEWGKTAQSFRFYADRDEASYITSTLVDPIDQPPSLEPADGTRVIQLTLRNPSSPYTGY